MKMRLRFSKADPVRWLSHLELSRAWIRVFIRAGLPPIYSQGFNPHPKIAFSPALPVGVAGLAEYMDVELPGASEAAAVAVPLNEAAPDGFSVTEAMELPPETKIPSLAGSIAVADYRLRVSGVDLGELTSVLTRHGITDKKGSGEHDVPALLGFEEGEGCTGASIRVPIHFKPLALTDAATGEGLPVTDTRIDRTALWVIVNGCLVDPMTAVGG